MLKRNAISIRNGFSRTNNWLSSFWRRWIPRFARKSALAIISFLPLSSVPFAVAWLENQLIRLI
ncbi:Uncharacterised protein [Mycobacteroides abscessus subsp. abscessus]|nr:Uncharacterised protein [Mycobacteroides abscessus subsp. abscessus]